MHKENASFTISDTVATPRGDIIVELTCRLATPHQTIRAGKWGELLVEAWGAGIWEELFVEIIETKILDKPEPATPVPTDETERAEKKIRDFYRRHLRNKAVQ